ncbi:MAG TPA: hypothetical protein VFZ69_10330 [Longimicrobiales bacterium]
MRKSWLAALPALLFAAACSDPTSSADQVAVTVAFATSDAGGTQSNGQLVLTGTNGTLAIDELRVIVDRFELKRTEDDACVEEDHSCERFRAPPLFIDVPLTGASTVAIEQAVEPGTYRRLKFEIEDLEDDDDTPTRAAEIAQLLSSVRAQFPEWPREASMQVRGTFTPNGGTPQAFTTYFEAEVDIRMDLVPPVTIVDDGDGAKFTVVLDPALWFRFGDGTVRDLSALDFSRTGVAEEFEIEIENGFAEIEFED